MVLVANVSRSADVNPDCQRRPSAGLAARSIPVLLPLTEKRARLASLRVARLAVGMQALHQLAVSRERHDALPVAFVLVPLSCFVQLGSQEVNPPLEAPNLTVGINRRRCGLGRPGFGLCMLFALMSERHPQY